MGKFVADAAIRKMSVAGKTPKTSRVAILGLTFKENCPDTRNSKVADIITRLEEYGIRPVVIDPWASRQDAKHEYNVELQTMEALVNLDCLIVAVAHDEFRRLTLDQLDAFFKQGQQSEKVLIDVKGVYKISDVEKMGFAYWRL